MKLERKMIETALVSLKSRNAESPADSATRWVDDGVNLYIISVNVIIEVMLMENVSNNISIKHKTQWANDQTLRKGILEFNVIREFSCYGHTT